MEQLQLHQILQLEQALDLYRVLKARVTEVFNILKTTEYFTDQMSNPGGKPHVVDAFDIAPHTVGVLTYDTVHGEEDSVVFSKRFLFADNVDIIAMVASGERYRPYGIQGHVADDRVF